MPPLRSLPYRGKLRPPLQITRKKFVETSCSHLWICEHLCSHMWTSCSQLWIFSVSFSESFPGILWENSSKNFWKSFSKNFLESLFRKFFVLWKIVWLFLVNFSKKFFRLLLIKNLYWKIFYSFLKNFFKDFLESFFNCFLRNFFSCFRHFSVCL